MAHKSPFKTKQRICELSNRYLEADAKKPITDQQCLCAGAALRMGDDERSNLRIVVRWKLQTFVKRFEWVRDFPNNLMDQEISHALIPAREMIDFSDDRTVCHALRILDSLPFIGIPVASAILMAMYPEDFTIIDRQAYKGLGAKFRDPISPSEYLAYLVFCRKDAKKFEVTLRTYDQALWQHGSEI